MHKNYFLALFLDNYIIITKNAQNVFISFFFFSSSKLCKMLKQNESIYFCRNVKGIRCNVFVSLITCCSILFSIYQGCLNCLVDFNKEKFIRIPYSWKINKRQIMFNKILSYGNVNLKKLNKIYIYRYRCNTLVRIEFYVGIHSVWFILFV